MRQPAERQRMEPIFGAVLPDRAALPRLRRRDNFPFSVGGRVAKARDVRVRRGAHFRRSPVRRAGLRVAAWRARLGLSQSQFADGVIAGYQWHRWFDLAADAPEMRA